MLFTCKRLAKHYQYINPVREARMTGKVCISLTDASLAHSVHWMAGETAYSQFILFTVSMQPQIALKS